MREQPWRPLKAITLDLWGTILFMQDPQEKIERRRAMLLSAIHSAGHECTVEQLRAGFRAARAIIDDIGNRERRDIGPRGRWSELMRQLGFPEDSVPFSAVEAAYEGLTLEYLPPLMNHVGSAIERLASRYRLGLICNTGYTGGGVLRQVLAEHRLDGYFRPLTFSNEFGFLKPDPRIFHHTLAHMGASPNEALHVGDVEELDIHGARAAGMYAARYVADDDGNGPVSSEADLVYSDWSEFADLIESRQAV